MKISCIRTLVRSEKSEYKMEDDLLAARRLSTRIRKVAPKMGAALADANNRSQVILFFFLLLIIHCISGRKCYC
jgi:hypothetical protein